MHKIRQIIILTVLGFFSLSASAIVLEQSPLDGGDGSLSVGPSGIQIAADNFQFASDAQLTSISWWGSYDPAAPVTESFTVRLFEDDGFGNPETNFLFETIFTGTGDSSGGLTDLFGGTVYQYDISVNQSLQGGVDYYLSVFNNDHAQDWFWLESAAGNGTGWSRAADGDIWNFDQSAPNMSYRLTTNVPEPATLLLMLLPLLWFKNRFSHRTIN
ncbi:hypothetical protein [Nitrosomonas sp.]|uniref:DUF7901 domain-containing protein n=1 Tax=Nitrosomonas sp. TaxID=42353 RepID=UPI0020830C04|nr:hypothetical protein [Nitrosomonas sp.]GJL76867.1 MAG: hypothetical protein NMNS02_29730 [Nitrosomonas sp.]